MNAESSEPEDDMRIDVLNKKFNERLMNGNGFGHQNMPLMQRPRHQTVDMEDCQKDCNLSVNEFGFYANQTCRDYRLTKRSMTLK